MYCIYDIPYIFYFYADMKHLVNKQFNLDLIAIRFRQVNILFYTEPLSDILISKS